jgi:hypothetical protein
MPMAMLAELLTGATREARSRGATPPQSSASCTTLV